MRACALDGDGRDMLTNYQLLRALLAFPMLGQTVI